MPELQRWHTVLVAKPDAPISTIFGRLFFITEFANPIEGDADLIIISTPSFHPGGVSSGLFSFYLTREELDAHFFISDRTLQDLQREFWDSAAPTHADEAVLLEGQLDQLVEAFESTRGAVVTNRRTFDVYDSPFDLFRAHFLADATREDLIETIRRYAVEGNFFLEDLQLDDNVLKIDDHWVYALDWKEATSV